MNDFGRPPNRPPDRHPFEGTSLPTPGMPAGPDKPFVRHAPGVDPTDEAVSSPGPEFVRPASLGGVALPAAAGTPGERPIDARIPPPEPVREDPPAPAAPPDPPDPVSQPERVRPPEPALAPVPDDPGEQRTLTPEDIAEAQRLLGYPIAPTPGLQPGEHDERRAIVERALQAKDALRDDMRRAAEAVGIEVTAEDLAAWQPNETEQAAIHQRLAPQRVRARMLDSFASFIEDNRATSNAHGTPLRPQQVDMLNDCGHFVLCATPTTPEGGKAGVVNAPPGVGKTGVISTLTAALKYKEDPTEPVEVVVIENTVNVMHQTHGKEGDRGYGKFAPHLDVGLRYHAEKNIRHITIMPAASFNYLMERGEMPNAHVVIADEVDTYTNENLRKYTADKIAVGFSATVDEATRELMPHHIYDMSMPEAIGRGLLAPTTAEVLHVDAHIDMSALPEDRHERRAMIDAANLRARIEDAKPRIKADIEAGRSVLVRCPSGSDIEVARVLAEELRDIDVVVPNDGSWPPQFSTMTRKMRAMEIGGTAQATPAGRRLQQAAFRRYDEGDADAFTFVKAMQRGRDVPRAKTIYDLDTTGGWREKTQAYGRVSRLLFDGRGRPIEARIVNYFDPRRPDQYTGVQLLGGDPGQDMVRVTYGRGGGFARTASEERALLVDSGLLKGSTTTTIEVRSVTHGSEVLAPDTTQLPPGAVVRGQETQPPTPDYPESPEAREPAQPLTFDQAAARLGVSPTFLRNLYETHGYDRDSVISGDDLGAMLELSYPSVQIEPPPLPQTGYVSDREVTDRLGMPGMTPVKLRLMAQYRGFAGQKFLAGGVAGYYFPEERLPELLEALKRPVQPPRQA